MIDPQIRCVELVELVTDWMEGQLDDDTRAHIEEHLAICPPCGAYVTQIRQATTLLQELDTDVPPPAAREELLRMFRSQGRG